MNDALRDKFYGCLCGSQIGSAMGAAVEGWPYSETEARYGTLDKLLPYEHYNNGWLREPGTTEDGIERQKLMITAIMEKQDRVNAEDVRAIWVRDIHPDAPGNVSEPFEHTLLAMATAGVPARDIGKYCDYANLVSFARSCHAIGLINAGDTQTAVEDVMEVGQLYQSSNSRGLRWACVTAVAIASATKPDATVESVIQAVLDCSGESEKVHGRGSWKAAYAGREIADEIQHALEKTKDCQNFRDLRQAFDSMYNAYGLPYSQSFANEIVTKGICVFRMVRGNVKDAIIAAVNMGRDTDCLAAVAGGISGAFSGAGVLPEEWINQVDRATQCNPFTNNKRTLRESADGLYNAYVSRLHKTKALADRMGV